MGKIFTSLSKKEQVAESIKKKLRRNKTAVGTRLDSVRNLAKSFGVSIKVIVDALDILEEERLISREAGRGVFVRGCDSRPLEIAILGAGIELQRNDFFQHLVAMSSPPNLRKGFNFVVRTVPIMENNNDQVFINELKQFERLANADCLLINTPLSNKKRVEFCTKLKTPIVFIGDFTEGDYQDLKYHQLVGNNSALGRLAAQELLTKEKTSRMSLFIGSSERSFYREYIEGVVSETKARGVELEVIEMPKGTSSSMTASERHNTYRDKIKQALKNSTLDCPGLSTGLQNDLLQEVLNEVGVKATAIYDASESEDDRKHFHDAIYSKIQTVLAEPDCFEKSVYSAQKVVLTKIV